MTACQVEEWCNNTAKIYVGNKATCSVHIMKALRMEFEFQRNPDGHTCEFLKSEEVIVKEVKPGVLVG